MATDDCSVNGPRGRYCALTVPVARVLAFILIVAALAAPAAADFSAQRASFEVLVDDTIVPYRVFAIFVLPDSQVNIETRDGASSARYAVEASGGMLTSVHSRRWRWRAPASSGLSTLRVAREGADEVLLNVFVMVPAARVRDGHLNDFRIDAYPRTPFRGLDAYRAPRGFVEVTPGNRAARVSPHFSLEQFLVKQVGGFPKYLVLRPTLLLKLEAILEAVNDAGHEADTLHVMSGYRTPFYNRAIGNGANSRHIYGDAADVFIDANPRDGQMDDLDGNGRIDEADSQVLADLIDRMTGRGVLRALRAIRRADAEGLQPEDYHLTTLDALLARGRTSLQGSGGADVSTLASLDLLLTDAFLVYGAHLLAGQVDPVSVDAEWHANRPEADLAQVLQDGLDQSAIAAALESLRPTHPAYARLTRALADYRAIQVRGGWAPVRAGDKLERGTEGERVRVLRARLAATVDLPAAAATGDVFDDDLDQAVRRFQQRHGLDVDGVVGPATLASLNVPVADRIRQVVVNLERWRWLPQDLGSRYILVNIPAFELEVVVDGTRELEMRVIVGRQYRRTPVFSGSMTYLVLNPYWNVPPGIATADILPRLRQDPGYLAAQNMKLLRQVDGRIEEVDPYGVDWTSVTARTFRYQLRQDPGPTNSLGRVKFMFPNEFNVSLHDTPARELFARTARSFSSGCIRLERPLDLAAYLLRDLPSWTPEAVNDAVARLRDHTVRLSTPMPIHLLYWTAWVEDDRIHFRPDIYQRDPPLAAALVAPPPRP